MAEVFLLDTGPLGMLTHPRSVIGVKEWLERALFAGESDPAAPYILVPEIADYELRRQLLLDNRQESIRRLEALEERIGYLRLDTATVRRAAELWAQARQRGLPTADDKALDGDVLLAAQAQSLSARGMEPTVITDNVGHLDRFVSAKRWVAVTGGVRAWAGVEPLLPPPAEQSNRS